MKYLFGRCRYYWAVNILVSTAKKKYIKKHKKKQKLNWNTDARNRTWAVRVRVRYRCRNSKEYAYNYFKSHGIIMNLFFFICFFF